MSEEPDDDTTAAPDAVPTIDELLRAKALPSVEREHLLARLAAINATEDDDMEER